MITVISIRFDLFRSWPAFSRITSDVILMNRLSDRTAEISWKTTTKHAQPNIKQKVIYISQNYSHNALLFLHLTR